ncbi:glycoside hydrolase family 10 protein, partial [Tulasnella calospora MUT 4182]
VTPFDSFSEFGMVTPGNAMKWDTIEATQNVFNYNHGDYIVDWAHTRGQTVRGHTFVWHSQLPSWLTSGTWDSATLTSILQNHIANEGGHYAGKLYAWDVVNEIFNEDGTWRSTIWYNTLGSSFVSIAFNAAHAADTGAKLYMNDYNVEGTGSKSDAYYALAQTLLAQGVPVHGMGAQAHLIVGSLPGNLSANIARFVALGLEWAYTELDIRITLPTTDALLATQASNYASITTACLSSSGCVGITVWDTSDDYSWVPSVFSGQGAALLFDANKQPKPAYKAVADVLAAATINGNFNSWYTPGGSSTTSASSTTTTTVSSTSVSSTVTSTATPIPLRGLNTLAKAKGRYFGTALDGLWSNTDTVYQALSGK